MNVRMWEHQSTKQNLNKLKNFDYKIIGPEIGDMACGEYGEGKMSDPSTIATEIDSFFSKQKIIKDLKHWLQQVQQMNILIQLDLLLINLVVNKDMQLLNLYLEKVLIQL